MIFIIKKISTFILTFIFLLTFSFSAEVLAADTLYYTALGDSISYGTEHSSFFMEHPNAYPNLIRDKFQKSGKNAVLDNLSIPGATTSALLEQLNNDSLTQQAVEKANLITISIGGNDVLYAAVRSGYTEIQDDTAKEGIKSYCDNMSRIIAKINSLNKGKPTILIMNLYNPYHPLEWGNVIYEDGSRENGYLHDMIYKKYLVTMQDKLIELSKEFKNVRIVDTYKSFESPSRFSDVTTIAAADSPKGIIYSSYFSKGTACTDTYTNFYKYPYEPFNMPFLRDLHPTITGQQLIADEHWKIIKECKIVK